MSAVDTLRRALWYLDGTRDAADAVDDRVRLQALDHAREILLKKHWEIEDKEKENRQ